MGLLGSSESAFEEVFVVAYQLLDVVWLEQGATYMEFPAVMRCALRCVLYSSCWPSWMLGVNAALAAGRCGSGWRRRCGRRAPAWRIFRGGWSRGSGGSGNAVPWQKQRLLRATPAATV